MNKLLNIFRHILFLIVIILIIILNIKIGINFKILLLYISFIILLIINIRDIKYKRRTSNKFNILYCLAMLLTIFLVFRTLLDKTLIYNSLRHVKLLEEMNTINKIYSYEEFGINYFSQNIIYILIIYICLIFYKNIEVEKINYKYSNTSLACLLINFVLSLKTIDILTQTFDINHFPLLFFVVNIILLVVEITSLVKNNKKKKDYTIYLCFLFNLFNFIAIFT